MDLFTIPLSKSLQAQLSAVQITFTVFILTETWLVPFEGYLVDRLGARLIVTLGGILVALSWVGPGVGQSLSALYYRWSTPSAASASWERLDPPTAVPRVYTGAFGGVFCTRAVSAAVARLV